MVVKEPFTIDLFDGRHFGAWTGEFEETDRGTKPKIRRMGFTFFKSLMPFLNRSKPFNYEIDREKNVFTYHTNFGLTFKILVPTDDVPECNVDQTIYGKMLEFTGRLKETNTQRVKELRRENKKLERKIEKLQEEEEERQKHQSRQRKDVECPKCGKSYSYQRWTANDGECPNCETEHPKYSDK